MKLYRGIQTYGYKNGINNSCTIFSLWNCMKQSCLIGKNVLHFELEAFSKWMC